MHTQSTQKQIIEYDKSKYPEEYSTIDKVKRKKLSVRKSCFGLNCRIPCHLFACHWIRIASIVLCFVLQRTPTNENNGGTEWQGIQQLLPVLCRINCPLISYLISKQQAWPDAFLRAFLSFLVDCTKSKVYLLTFWKPISLAYCLKHLRQMFKPYFLIIPWWLKHTRLWKNKD